MMRLALVLVCGLVLATCGGASGFVFDAGVDAPTYEAPPGRAVVDLGRVTSVDSTTEEGGRASGAPCDIVNQDCGGDLACYRGGCASPGRAGRGDACGVDGDCLPQNVCVLVDGAYSCQRACLIDSEAPCEGKCHAIPGQTDVGRCVL